MRPLRVVLVFGMVGGAGFATALRADQDSTASFAAGAEYAPGGEAACVECHDETEEYPVLSIFKTRHGVKADARTPLASGHACQSCHGPSAEHVKDELALPAVSFSDKYPTAPQNEACMGCHRGGLRMNWTGSPHESQNLACASCHTIHTQDDPVLVSNLNPTEWHQQGAQAEVCFGCHKNQRAQAQRFSSHPIREGQVRCSDCHNTHGSPGSSNLIKPTINEVCYTCHAEKRGPFLWEHAPAREDCTTCHTPHGSNHRPLLKTRMTSLCQQCHAASFHPSTSYDGSDVPTGNRFVSRACLACHPEVHGSNHPSGVRWSR